MACVATARPAGEEAGRPATNIRAGTRYLRDLLDLFPGQLELALAAYNAGEGAVQRAGNRIPNYRETQNYVKTVLQLYN
jgi:soluble lytic murein transglycosylase-like protein